MSLKRRELVTGDGSSGGLGGVWMRWSITRQGREKVGEILARDNYRGPAPVPVEQYLVQLQQQRLTRYRVSPRRVERAFSKLPSGQKMKLPFDCLVVFSTNLDPRSLADDAFLRRIRYKIRVGPPSAAMYREIFRRQCEALGIPYDGSAVDYLLRMHYLAAGRSLRACEPRDLLQQMRDIHRYSGGMPVLTPMAIDRLAEIYFGELEPEADPLMDRATDVTVGGRWGADPSSRPPSTEPLARTDHPALWFSPSQRRLPEVPCALPSSSPCSPSSSPCSWPKTAAPCRPRKTRC